MKKEKEAPPPKASAAAPPPKAKADKRPPQYPIFLSVFQCDYPGQMDVFRWLISDSMFRVVYILHDRDTYTQEDMDEKGEHKRKDGEGKEITYHVGDTKPAHIHAIVQVPKKCTEATMLKRFGGYVFFDGCSDVNEYARYLTHETYRSRNKFRYSRDCVKGDLAAYLKWMHFDDDCIQHLTRWSQYMQQARTIAENMVEPDSPDYYVRVEYIARKTAVNMAINAGDLYLIHSIMSHGYFYSKFT